MKKTIILLLSVLLLTNLTACHQKRSLSVFIMPEEFDQTKNYEITFWAKSDNNKYQEEIYRQTIKDFEECYPNIKVKLVIYTDYSRIYNDVITNIQTNTTPNVCIGYPDNVSTYLTGENVVVKLNELMDDEKYGFNGSEVNYESVSKNEIVNKFLDECYLNDGYYMLPFVRSTEVTYINKDYVEKLGYQIPDILTWDFIFEVSKKALEKNEDGTYKINGKNVLIPFIYKSTDNMMIQMLKQQNAPYSNKEGDILIFNDQTRHILKSIAPYAQDYAFSTFKIDSYPANFINAGECIFGVDSSAGATWMGSEAANLDINEEDVISFEMVVRPVPQYDINNPQMISQGPSICLFNKEDNQEVLASWLFAQYLLTSKVQMAYSQTEGYLPVTNQVLNSSEYQNYLSLSGSDNNEHYSIKIDAVKLFMNNIDNTFVTEVFNGSASLRDAAGQMIEEVTKGIRRGNDINDTYLDNLFERMNSLYRLSEHQNGLSSSKKDFGELPTMAKGLLIGLATIWSGIGLYWVLSRKKK